jgi:hypothetical protein
MDFNASRQGSKFDRAGLQFSATPGTAVGLGKHGHGREARTDQLFQSWYSKAGSAGKHNTQG